MKKILATAALLTACLFHAGIASAAAQTCSPGATYTTSTPYSVCNPYTVQVPTGTLTCSQNLSNGNGSSDFAGAEDCVQNMISQTVANCSTQYRTATVTTPQVCVDTPEECPGSTMGYDGVCCPVGTHGKGCNVSGSGNH